MSGLLSLLSRQDDALIRRDADELLRLNDLTRPYGLSLTHEAVSYTHLSQRGGAVRQPFGKRTRNGKVAREADRLSGKQRRRNLLGELIVVKFPSNPLFPLPTDYEW